MHKTFIYKQNDLGGLFGFLRSKSLISSVYVSGPTSFNGGYCYHGTYAAPHSGIIDGDVLSAWANVDSATQNMYIIIDLSLNKFRLNGVSLRVPCFHAKTLMILGSNDGVDYHPIINLTSLVDEQTIFKSCELKPSYRYFKLTQDYVESYPEFYRLHISEIEFFGVLGSYFDIITCKKTKKESYFVLFIVNLILSV